MILTAFVACGFLLQCSLGMEPPELMNMQLSHHVTQSIVTTVDEAQTETQAKASLKLRSLIRPNFGENKHLKWVRWTGSLPSWTVSIYNQAAKRLDYICVPLEGCNWSTGHYSPSKGPYCYNPCNGKEDRRTQFDLLVNEQNLELLQWRAFSRSIPTNSIAPHAKNKAYSAKNHYGIGSVYKNIFFLPLNGKELKYKRDFDLLTLKKERYTQRIFNVEYHVDQLVTLSQAPVALGEYSATNKNCHSVKQTVQLEERTERQSTWQTSASSSLTISTSITVGIPIISVTASVAVTSEKTHTNGNSVTETISHSMSVEVAVPANHHCTVKMAGKKYKIKIPFTAHLAKEYTDGTSHTTTVTGVYQGLQVGEIAAVAERCQPNPNPQPCAA
ncbi:natterin-3-like [Salvelinus alpinus]|uniref:natterin-3-like n=1 Tax=Salvelinus alpinus TaxID=8036 RepID=UPI0039FBDD31